MTHLTDKEAEALIEQRGEVKRCSNCRKETDELFQVWDEELCKECYRIYKENKRINAREERKDKL